MSEHEQPEQAQDEQQEPKKGHCINVKCGRKLRSLPVWEGRRARRKAQEARGEKPEAWALDEGPEETERYCDVCLEEMRKAGQEVEKAKPEPTVTKLDKADVELVRLPREFWHTTRDKLAESLKKPVGRYLDDLARILRKEGISLLISGPRGTGKSGAASVIAKTARSLGFSVYWRLGWQYREDRRERRMFNRDISCFERAQKVDLLVLDDFRAEDAKDKYYGTHDVEGLLLHRAQHRRPTIVTTAFATDDDTISINRWVDSVPRLLDLSTSDSDSKREEERKALHERFRGSR
jgi:DNA replication protein DnaC